MADVKKMDFKIPTVAPSILSADFAKMAEELEDVRGCIDVLHIDVMDGHFVPNITFGPPVLKSIRKVTDKFLDVHLMISEPWRYINDFIDAGADCITIHLETCIEQGDSKKVRETLDMIKSRGIPSAISINPSTPLDDLIEFLPEIDMVLIMTVKPGFGGQSFMHDVMPKLKVLKNLIKEKGLSVLIEVDGGIDSETGHIAAEAGADIFVAGSAVFGKEDRCAAVNAIMDDIMKGK